MYIIYIYIYISFYIYIDTYQKIFVIYLILREEPSLGQTLINVKHKVKWMVKYVQTLLLLPYAPLPQCN